MATQKKSNSKKTAKAKTSASLVWFEVAADDLPRAKSFYGKLFGWKIKKIPGMDYWHIDTGGADASPDGGMMTRKDPSQRITNYISVADANKFAAKVEKLGGKICMPKTEVPGMGYFVICQDTENNMFALWEVAMKGK